MILNEPDSNWGRSSVPVQIPHHVVLEIRGDSPGEAGPGQQPVCLPLLHPVCLVAGLPLQVWVSQGHTDIIEQTRQRAQFDNGILQERKNEQRERLSH